MTIRRLHDTESWWSRTWPRVRVALWAIAVMILAGQLASCVPYRRRAVGYYQPAYVAPTYGGSYGYAPYDYGYGNGYGNGYYPRDRQYPYRDRVYVAPPRGVIVDPPGVRSTPRGPAYVPPRGPVYVTPPR